MSKALTLKDRRTRLGLTQQQVAEPLNLSQQTIARWEGGGEVPSKHLKDLAVLLNCRIADLIPPSEAATDATWRPGDRVDDATVEFGTLRINFPAPARILGEDLRTPEDEGDDARYDLRYEYAISRSERRRIDDRLARRDDNTLMLIFETLDNRFVFVNRTQIESIELIAEVIEETPPYAHEEIYRALADYRVRDILENAKLPEDFESEAFPYSKSFISECVEAVGQLGGLEAAYDRVSSITIETVDGRRATFPAEQEVYEELSLLAIDIEGVAYNDETPQSEWIVDLYPEGFERSTLYRLGALRLIEAPLIEHVEANRRAMEGE